MAKMWNKESWRGKTGLQMPDYPDQDALEGVLTRLESYPPLVFAGEIRRLKARLAAVARGEAFLLQGGDCAEAFMDMTADNIRESFRILLQMAVVLTYGAKKPVVKVGRLAGQFAKPRSAPTETVDGVELPSYRGDIINDLPFTPEARLPRPEKMLEAYQRSAGALNLLRAFASGGYADLRRVAEWNNAFAGGPEAERYRGLADKVMDALEFMQACGIDSRHAPRMRRVDFYISHEALLLPYEEALTRVDSTSPEGEVIAGSTHMIWIGDRTRQPDGAHVEYARGVINPVGIKCGPGISPDELCQLIETINPQNELGRIVLIGRFGVGKVEAHLPALIEAVKKGGYDVIWSCDPMHGNTHKSASGYKTRAFEAVLDEVAEFFGICYAEDVYPGGVHIEMTGQDVTECIGGLQELGDADLSDRYHTACDPRLNGSQSLELSFRIAEMLMARANAFDA